MQQNNPLAGIRFDQTTGVVCSNRLCGCKTFTEVLYLRKVSRFLLGVNTDKDQIIPVPAFACSKCGNVNSEFLPEGLRNDNNANDITDIDGEEILEESL